MVAFHAVQRDCLILLFECEAEMIEGTGCFDFGKQLKQLLPVVDVQLVQIRVCSIGPFDKPFRRQAVEPVGFRVEIIEMRFPPQPITS